MRKKALFLSLLFFWVKSVLKCLKKPPGLFSFSQKIGGLSVQIFVRRKGKVVLCGRVRNPIFEICGALLNYGVEYFI
jgi:hypothetical protein